MWREKIFLLVREVKKIRAGTKKLRFHFFRKHVPQSERFRFVFLCWQVMSMCLQGRCVMSKIGRIR
ncbi:DUF1661 domain-containing protein [Porphyromonas gingivalis]|uniref:DUF1661 domain-containing protein n=2 Tax=Porphyromonas gingivalis TaxID=837 RepID=A0AAF0BB62_PORGN|nr:DUF1661 domain-containing protein [Porphyromonas gingivalis]WCG03934.1 DUF1661 domain-containing protein [Porphyromonas gingivalis]